MKIKNTDKYALNVSMVISGYVRYTRNVTRVRVQFLMEETYNYPCFLGLDVATID
jgi:hypothetical protein